MVASRFRLLVWIGAMLILGFVSIIAVSFFVSRHSIRQGIAQESLPLTADNVYSEIQKDLLRPVFISSLMARDTFVRDWIIAGERDTDRIARYLKEVQEKYGTVISFLATDKTHRYYYQHGLLRPLEGPEGSTDKWFYRVRNMSAAYETNVDPDELNPNIMSVYINYRVMDYQGRFIGVTGVGLTFDSLNQLLDSYQEKFHRRIFFIDASGKVVLTGRGMSQLRGTSIRQLPGIADVAQTILSGRHQDAHLSYQRDRTLVLLNSRFIPELGWTLVVEQDEGEGTQSTWNVLIVSLFIGTTIVLLVLAMVRLAVSRYQERIEAMSAQALRHAEREMELAGEQQQFVAMVSHEFRTPLAIIDTALQSLKRQEADLPPEVASRHRMMHRAGLRLRELIDNYLTSDHLRQATLTPRRETLDLFELAARVVRRAEWPNVSSHFGGQAAPVEGDEELLQIVLANLISNAVKYSPEGAPVRITGSVTEDHVEVHVADRGVGIAAAELPRIFDKYHRAAGNRASGAGLGLYLVKRIVEAHGGAVTVESRPETGTIFRVLLPLSRNPG